MTRAELNALLTKADISDDQYITFATPNGAEFGGISDVLVSGNNTKTIVLCGSHSDENWCAKPDSAIEKTAENWCDTHNAPIVNGQCSVKG